MTHSSGANKKSTEFHDRKFQTGNKVSIILGCLSQKVPDGGVFRRSFRI